MTALGYGKIWILVLDWSRLKSSEPKAVDITRKINPLYFIYSSLFDNIFKVKNEYTHTLKLLGCLNPLP